MFLRVRMTMCRTRVVCETPLLGGVVVRCLMSLASRRACRCGMRMLRVNVCQHNRWSATLHVRSLLFLLRFPRAAQGSDQYTDLARSGVVVLCSAMTRCNTSGRGSTRFVVRGPLSGDELGWCLHERRRFRRVGAALPGATHGALPPP